MKLRFPPGFLWGASISAYQTEGGINNNDWAEIFPAGKACDHYHRFEEDFSWLEKLNLNSFRFSVEWSRIEPQEGVFNQKAISFYSRYLKELKKRRIKTFLTLWHFTTPLWLSKKGGWENPKSVFYFSRFSEKVFFALNPWVDFWITINEPLVYAVLAYFHQRWPPQKKNLLSFFRVIFNQIKAHKKVYYLFHQKKDSVKVGVANNNQLFLPYSGQPLEYLSCLIADWFQNQFFLSRIKKELDFIGLNYYFRFLVKFPFRLEMTRGNNEIISDIGWPIYPQGIYFLLLRLKKYHLPIYITENGIADKDDKLRKEFIREHLFWIHQAIQKGVDVRGYLYWSLMDNFEWDYGFDPRFGLLEIDYQTFSRLPRPSAYYYQKIAQNNALEY